MTNEKPDISPLEQAIQGLDAGLQRYLRDVSDTEVRDGLIHRLKCTYELSHRMLKRYLEYTAATPDQYDSMAFQDLIRSGNEQGLLLGEWPHWRRYRDMRGKTSHTYAEAVALEVVASIPEFLQEARFLQAQLQERLA